MAASSDSSPTLLDPLGPGGIVDPTAIRAECYIMTCDMYDIFDERSRHRKRGSTQQVGKRSVAGPETLHALPQMQLL